MIKVCRIKWLSREIKEAEVFLSDGIFDINCFSHPFGGNIGDVISQPLYTLNAREVYKIDNESNEDTVKKGEEAFNYKLEGTVINSNDNQIKVGEFIFELDIPLSGDIHNGSYVSFICDRIDIW